MNACEDPRDGVYEMNRNMMMQCYQGARRLRQNDGKNVHSGNVGINESSLCRFFEGFEANGGGIFRL